MNSQDNGIIFPFCDDMSDSVSAISEKTLIARIGEILGNAALPSPYGSGDDCALVKKSSLEKNVFFTGDSVIAGVHFTPDTAPDLVGEKLVKRNISDVASMGGRPVSGIVTCVYSKNLSLKWLDGFASGLRNAALKYEMKIVGGDMASIAGNFFSAELSLLGTSKSRVLERKGARVGDFLCVTGALGLSFKSGRHLSFEPRVPEGQFFATEKSVHSCTDLSDGFASDAKNLLPPNCSACLNPTDVPRTEFDGKKASLDEALCGGEDYELCASVSPKSLKKLGAKFAEKFGRELFVVGRIEKAAADEGGELVLCEGGKRKIYRASGWSH